MELSPGVSPPTGLPRKAEKVPLCACALETNGAGLVSRMIHGGNVPVSKSPLTRMQSLGVAVAVAVGVSVAVAVGVSVAVAVAVAVAVGDGVGVGVAGPVMVMRPSFWLGAWVTRLSSTKI